MFRYWVDEHSLQNRSGSYDAIFYVVSRLCLDLEKFFGLWTVLKYFEKSLLKIKFNLFYQDLFNN